MEKGATIYVQVKPECFDPFMAQEGIGQNTVYKLDLRRDRQDGAYYINGKPYHQSRFEEVSNPATEN